MKQQRKSPGRAKALKTIKERYGKDHFKNLGKLPHKRGFSDPEVARKASNKRWDKNDGEETTEQ